MNEDQLGALVAGVVLALASVGVWRVTDAAASGRIQVNRAIGLRTPATMTSQQAWQEAHRAALPVVRPLCAAAGATAVAGAAAGSWPPAGITLVLVASALLVGAAVTGGVVGHLAARRSSA